MSQPYIIAEMGAAHCGSLKRALDIVDAAKQAGADAVKLQTWDEMTVANHVIADGPWAGRQLRDLYEECKLPWDWHGPIFARARRIGLAAFSTPFDQASVDYLESLNAPIYKVASFEITHLQLIRKAAGTGKPIILSTGMATEAEIEAAVDAATTAGAGGITLLKCVSAYPAPLEEFNLLTMAHMVERFGCQVGLSDHTRGPVAATAATALGAVAIEKHLSLDGNGPDGGFAATPAEFAVMVRAVRECAALVGGVAYGPTTAEGPSLALRRSLWITKDVAAGELLTVENMAVLRPLGGAAPDEFGAFLGQRVVRDVSRGTPVSTHLVDTDALNRVQ